MSEHVWARHNKGMTYTPLRDGWQRFTIGGQDADTGQVAGRGYTARTHPMLVGLDGRPTQEAATPSSWGLTGDHPDLTVPNPPEVDREPAGISETLSYLYGCARAEQAGRDGQPVVDPAEFPESTDFEGADVRWDQTYGEAGAKVGRERAALAAVRSHKIPGTVKVHEGWDAKTLVDVQRQGGSSEFPTVYVGTSSTDPNQVLAFEASEVTGYDHTPPA